jgi:hypothetical protein
MARKRVNKSDVDEENIDVVETTETEFDDGFDSPEDYSVSENDRLKSVIQDCKIEIHELENSIGKLLSQKKELVDRMDKATEKLELLENGSGSNGRQRHAMSVINAIAKQRETENYKRSPLDMALGNRQRPNFMNLKG